jgi:hypothetical protein
MRNINKTMRYLTKAQAGNSDSGKCALVTAALVMLAVSIAGCGPVPVTPEASTSLLSPIPTPTVTPEPSLVITLPEASEPIPASNATIPTPVPEPTSTPEPTPEIEEAATRFTWTVDPGIRLEDASVPGVSRLEDGRFRMYYGGPGGILSAISEDGTTFTKETGVRVPSGAQGGTEMIVSDPTMVTRQDGQVRIYYKGATGPGGPGQSIHTIYSAISTDGLHFEKEGIRIDSQQTPDRGWASVPEAIILPDGRVRLYYVSDGLDVKHGIVSAISDDGLSFTREGPVLSGFVDPAVIRLADGRYLMLAVTISSVSLGIEPGIYSFLSEDGINFQDREPVLIGENNIDPAIVDMGDGAYRVYYWNATDKPSAIKSISGQMTSTP